MDRIEELLQAPYWIIDILPMQVPKDSPGQYFAVEDYFLKEQLAEIKRKHINVILKLNCYMDISIEEESNPAPEKIAAVMKDRYIYILIGNSVILSEPDDAHMTVFNPDEQLLELIRTISTAEGLFVWKP
jgi:disulfide oxidoreductase YuzD